jgi:CDP-paratose 2-epimerase
MVRDLQKPSHKVLISGGAGFIGSNLAAHLLAATDVHVTLYDNLSREGSEANLAWLRQQAAPGRLHFLRSDVRNSVSVSEAVTEADEVYHLAARCPETPESRADYDVNVTGTLNILDAARRSAKKPMLLFASLGETQAQRQSQPFQWTDSNRSVNRGLHRVVEDTPAGRPDAYECSISAADAFMRDYARDYGVKTVVLRLDTVAGPRQFGGDPHAWVSNAVRAVLAGWPVRVNGNGMQVRDVLHVSDLVEAIGVSRAYIDVMAGKVYDIGGGLSHQVSVNEMIQLIERVCYRKAHVQHTPSRNLHRSAKSGETLRFMAETGWMVRRSLEQTVRDLACFWRANESRRVERAPGFAPTFTRAA